jgi:hypothetical protein
MSIKTINTECTPEMLRAAALNSELGDLARNNLSGAWDLIIELWDVMLKNAIAVEPANADTVPIPQSADQAELMQKSGYAYLQQHAPERLIKAEPFAYISSDAVNTLKALENHVTCLRTTGDSYSNVPLFLSPQPEIIAMVEALEIGEDSWMSEEIAFNECKKRVLAILGATNGVQSS